MAIDHITRRFTLHDLVAFFLAGSLCWIGIAAVVMIARASNVGTVAELTQLFVKLHVASQLLVFVTTAYFLGLLSVTIGDLLYWLFFKLRGKDYTLLLNSTSKWAIRSDISKMLADRLKDDHHISNPPAEKKDQVSLAYSHLMQADRDSFVQLMSARGATFAGIAGAFLIITVACFIVALASYATSQLWNAMFVLKIVAFLAALVGVECLTLAKVRDYECWWGRHVVFGYLAMRAQQEISGSNSGEKSSTSAG